MITTRSYFDLKDPFSQIFPNVEETPWRSHLKWDAYTIKLNLFTIGVNPTYIFQTCNKIDDSNHAIFECFKYTTQRRRFKIFNRFANL